MISCHQNLRYTFREVLKQANELAAGFQAIGLQKGDMLGLWAPNLAEWYISKMACARAGLVMVKTIKNNQLILTYYNLKYFRWR